jgi:OOP family OmpA-OmpF porin
MRGSFVLRLAWVVSCAVTLLAAATAVAQSETRAIDTQRFTPAFDAEGFLGVPGTSTPGSMRPTFGFFLDYTYAALETTYGVISSSPGSEPETKDIAAVEHRVSGYASAQLGLGTRAAVGVLVPVALGQTSEVLRESGAELAPIAIADPLLSARYRLLGVASEDPFMPKDGPGVGIELRVRPPLGSDTTYLGEGTTRLGARLLFDMQLLGAGIGGLVGYERRMTPRRVLGEKLSNELQLGAAAKVPIPPLHPLSAVGELRASLDFVNEDSSAFEGELGVRATFGAWTITAAGGAGFTGIVGSPDVRAIVGLWYAPLPSDSDHDGVDDDEDQCPMLAEDPDGFQDGDGCPDPDNDNDLVPDIDDLCPNVEALEGQDEDEDGCTDVAKPAG